MKLEIKIGNPEQEKLLKLFKLFKTETNTLSDIIKFCINFTYKGYYEDN